ncbi:hypothetical protein BpHYR1_023344 [Brachionus plicatilis]|uniref:Uncharacterized protein n=1 Tax=Brachionus plicatilis TaxID=10195 RepID=A0A3M7PY32_BRAPC|nr:hypothetical protein BpHYR1_023344 [Brachionus plicatilis]
MERQNIHLAVNLTLWNGKISYLPLVFPSRTLPTDFTAKKVKQSMLHHNAKGSIYFDIKKKIDFKSCNDLTFQNYGISVVEFFKLSNCEERVVVTSFLSNVSVRIENRKGENSKNLFCRKLILVYILMS